ncbi:oxidoreductase-like protein, putative [Bodo saltans]|uniref:Oxidoreductase-like protein, putative n=1 Tax=Bodo saltans TaxID=75058 RepID=A0A0S4IRH3_BODSA|nr:oxidoreductase-like protein, putative [Bodo saltans]|eukprot:CUE69034.1 oxidoreductase-like protein, putative [Bodo saltans]
MTTGVGFLGAAGIARKTWAALHAAGLRVVILGCRDVARGETFVNECATILNIPEADRPKVVGSYDDVVSHPDVSVVYIPLPVSFRDTWIRACAANGKHVVCEKPPAHNAEQLEEWIELLAIKNLMFMDGTMLSHGKRIEHLQAQLPSLVGTIRHIHQEFCFTASPDDIRQDPALEPMGALGDLGWYAVRYAQHLLGAPKVVSATCERNEKGGITVVIALLQYPCGATQTFRVGLNSASTQSMLVTGTIACLSLDDFCLPVVSGTTSYDMHRNTIRSVGCGVPHERHGETIVLEEDSTFQEVQMWRDVTTVVTTVGHDRRWSALSLQTQKTLDAIVAALPPFEPKK